MAIRMRWVSWIALLLLVVGGFVIIFTSDAIERTVAKQRWAQRPFEHYSLQVVDQDPLQTMLYSYQPRVEITDSTKPHTVSDLFDLLEQPRDLDSSCSPEPMTCPLNVTCQWTAIYHPTLGYPEQLVQRCSEHPNWLSAQLWRLPQVIWDACQDGGCRRLIYERTLAVEVTPLP